MRLTNHVAALAALALAAAPAAAQLPSPSAAAAALGDNFTALARGASAPAWNPAGLGLRANPSFSLFLMGTRADGGLDPVGLDELAKYDGQVVPDEVRDRWMSDISDAGRQRMEGTVGVTPVALSIGRVAFQLGTEAHGIGDIAPDAAELLLYGNAGRTGTTRDMSFAGTRFLATAVTTAAVSYAQPLTLTLGPLPDQRFAVGVTAKYLVGNALVMGRDRSGYARTTPLEVAIDLPIVQSDSAGDGTPDKGRGVGIDVGASWQAGPFTASAVVQNAVNTFRWNVDDMYWRQGRAHFDQDTSYSSFDSVYAIGSAPEALKAEVRELAYAPVLAFGGAWAVSRRLTLVGDVRQRIGEGAMNAGASSHVGVGAELRPFGFLPLRVGGSVAGGGYRLAGGLGLELGFGNLNASVGRRFGDGASDGIGAVTVSFGGR